jgi:hypothetical protein
LEDLVYRLEDLAYHSADLAFQSAVFQSAVYLSEAASHG